MTTASYCRGIQDEPLLDLTIGAILEQAARDHADRDAVVGFDGLRLTYRELDQRVDEVARGLMGLGVRRGDRVGMWSPNNAEWIYLQFATAKIGAILVNLNPAYRTDELRYAVRHSGCRVLVSATSYRSSDYVAMVAEARADLPDLEHVVFVGTSDWDELLTAGDAIDRGALTAREAALDIHDPINIQYTSGTTGDPKGATLSHHNLVNNGYFVGRAFGYDEADRACIPVPFYHCFGMVIGTLACVTHGAAIVLPARTFDATSTLRTIERERCTSLLGVPTMFIDMLAHRDFAEFDLSTLRTGMMAGAPCPSEVMRQCIDQMHLDEVTIGYGMTETSPISTQTARDDTIERRVGTVGRVHPHVEIEIIDPDTGATVERGEPGELCTRGYSVMLGYWNDPERTAEAIDADGWMHTGDLACMDQDGYVEIVGRIKDTIIRGGENISPREIEELLHTMPDVLDVQVVGVPDHRFGEELVAWIRTGSDAIVTVEDVRRFCTGKLAHFKIPRYVQVTDEFPMTVTGKVQKFRMRELSIERFGLA